MNITIMDIARAANVAKSTVSKVLNDSPKISAETKTRVRQIMKDMNYTPSSMATRLAKQKTYNIGLLIDMSQEQAYLNPFFYNIMVGIESAIGPRNYDLTVVNIQTGDAQEERHYLKRLVMSKRIDGLITNNSILTPEDAEKLEQLAFPYVSMGEYAGTSVSWVDFDNETGGRMLTEHLLSQSYTKIAFIGGVQGERLFSKRYQGYAEQLRAAGLPLREDWEARGIADEKLGYLEVKRLLELNEPPDSLICMNNQVALGALKAAKEIGMQVPDGLGIATFDDEPYSAHISPPLTSLYINTFELGAHAGQMVTDRIEQPELRHQGLLLQPEIIVRESTTRRI
ncbi:LacI family DNA-binding transcriptional regulator [Paenibacillus sp. LHD-117]|uniref:LacI family DNA-binding transcriptional regulator n=1 Tax=Paenibacillus sp. LHD-117 TaxID=3071412 RepID=UPI0027DFA6AE|nr:LacI family DNA-binding transcriptional regulator [Paenibacillus sp. LHD-117]MDQ6423515.1 LacI family DNA-binding transcriptional regulator [Paenibacillus sp. LHD-117]